MITFDTLSVIEFASNELKKYLKLLGVSADIKLGLFEDFNLKAEVEDPYFDDAYAIKVEGKKGYVSGVNGRSVLFAVYRLLEEWGIGWVRPGKDGTYIPKTTEAPDIDIFEVATKRHRTMCIEGAVSIENVLDMIEWIPKVGFNSYYIQFNDAFIFFDRWYNHTRNPLIKGEKISYDKALEYVDIMITEIKRRGLLLQRMGHGWNCDPFGVVNHGWVAEDPDTIPQEYKDICAVVNGKREVWKNMPIATQLCYSNPFVAKTMADGVVKYLEEHPETDVVHFWLGDYFNNTCECEECTKLRYSDYYLRIINLITEKLNEKGLKNKIAFSCGSNKGWVPVATEVEHPENMILTFAPISRTFGETFPKGFKIKTTPEYKLNGFAMPRSVDENLSYLCEWENFFDGDTIDFDYHLMWDHILDAGGEGIARVIHDDIINFESLGMNGYISCQLQRNAFPTSVAMTVMGKTLWSSKTDFDVTRKKLYANSFGEENAEMMAEYFSTLSKGFSIGAIRSQIKVDRNEFRANMVAAKEAFEKIEAFVRANLDDPDPCRRESWRIVGVHREIYSILADSIIAFIDGDNEKGNELRHKSIRLAWEKEPEVQSVMDGLFYQEMIESRINIDKAIAFFDF